MRISPSCHRKELAPPPSPPRGSAATTAKTCCHHREDGLKDGGVESESLSSWDEEKGAEKSSLRFGEEGRNAEDFALDLEELHHLYGIAKRPRTLSLLYSEIRNLEKLSSESSSAVASKIPAPISTGSRVSSAPSLNYSTIASFSWDQDNDKVKIYVSLEGVDESKMESEFKPTSFDVKFHDVQGKNYRFTILKLHKEIVPEKCKVVVKPTRVIITLFKASKANWLDLNYKEDKLKPNLDKEKDPMAGIMDLMKNMYEEGDDEMKKTIAKAWTDARSGKTADPLSSYR